MVFLSLSENDKRLIFALLLVFILVFVLIGYIGYLITRVMKWQGKKLDTLVADPVVTRVITNKRHFCKYARKKNWRLFVKQSYISILIMITGALVLILRDAIMSDFAYNVWDYQEGGTGFGTILFLFDFRKCFQIVNGSVLVSWPEVINTPHFEVNAIVSYIFMTCMIVGGLWYLIALQSLISRTIRMYQLSTSAFEKTLEGFNQNTQYANLAAAKFEQQNNENTQQEEQKNKTI